MFKRDVSHTPRSVWDGRETSDRASLPEKWAPPDLHCVWVKRHKNLTGCHHLCGWDVPTCDFCSDQVPLQGQTRLCIFSFRSMCYKHCNCFLWGETLSFLSKSISNIDKGVRYGKPGLLRRLLGATTNHDNRHRVGLNMIDCLPYVQRSACHAADTEDYADQVDLRDHPADYAAPKASKCNWYVTLAADIDVYRRTVREIFVASCVGELHGDYSRLWSSLEEQIASEKNFIMCKSKPWQRVLWGRFCVKVALGCGLLTGVWCLPALLVAWGTNCNDKIACG